MGELDPKSKEFIIWVMDQLGTEEQYWELVSLVIKQLRTWYYDQTVEQFMDKLEAKMIEGAKEHGEPKINPDSIQKEINNEAIDLIGWNLMLSYAKLNK